MRRYSPILLWVFILCLSFAARAEVIERIVAIVNDDIITQTDIESFMKKVATGGTVDELFFANTTFEEVKKDRAKALGVLINEKILDAEVKKRKLEASSETVEKEIKAIAERNGVSVDQLKKALPLQGIVFSEYQNFLKKRIEHQSAIEVVVSSKVKVTEEEIVEYYLKNYSKNDRVFEYSIAHILFTYKSGGKEGALKRSEMALKKIKEGVSFETVADNFSEDPNYTKGGLLGTFKAGEFLKSIENGVKDLNVGDTSPVVETPAGLHIFRLLSKKLVSDPFFEKEKPRIQAKLSEAAFKKQFVHWLEEQKELAYIKLN